MDDAGLRQEDAVAERAVAEILQHQDFATGIAEDGDDEIDVAIAVKVRRLHVGDTANVFEEDFLREVIAVVPQQDNLSDELVGGKDVAENRYHHVKVAVLVDVHDGGMGGNLEVFSEHLFDEAVVLRLAIEDDRVAGGVADEDVVESILVEVDDLDVRRPLGGRGGGPDVLAIKPDARRFGELRKRHRHGDALRGRARRDEDDAHDQSGEADKRGRAAGRLGGRTERLDWFVFRHGCHGGAPWMRITG